jgi:uridine kinase
MDQVHQSCQFICEVQRRTSPQRATLIGISGIDASGKGYYSRMIADQLTHDRYRVALISVDHWVALPSQRFSQIEPGRHFYDHGLRLDAMWHEAILPLQQSRHLSCTIQAGDATNAERYLPMTFSFSNIEIILLEGIFLFKRQYQQRYDGRFWIECGFEKGMQRAIHRNVEQLSVSEIQRDYETIYYPAQRLHFELDQPQACADITIQNG